VAGTSPATTEILGRIHRQDHTPLLNRCGDQAVCMLRLTVQPDDESPAFVLELSHRELVSAFYRSLREFALSDDYPDTLWEEATFGTLVRLETKQHPERWAAQVLAEKWLALALDAFPLDRAMAGTTGGRLGFQPPALAAPRLAQGRVASLTQPVPKLPPCSVVG
jgi:hypothetical protein